MKAKNLPRLLQIRRKMYPRLKAESLLQLRVISSSVLVRGCDVHVVPFCHSLRSPFVNNYSSTGEELGPTPRNMMPN
ncbi:hypothetical protein EUGRSUZ_B00959 [Eucalyptus grandis]|uniref:Uncharacterized protein n=2 Tax=Eucalyptus grandis TaxID=71139 RepID=A0ACC3LPG1_EUCGR|nr:hypothetical protein EUGRSUZ_B00959 [Eucalyptus grandis]